MMKFFSDTLRLVFFGFCVSGLWSLNGLFVEQKQVVRRIILRTFVSPREMELAFAFPFLSPLLFIYIT